MNLKKYANTETLKKLIVGIVILLGVAITYYCIKTIIDHKVDSGKQGDSSIRHIEPVVAVWGVYPVDACNTFEQQGIFAMQYKPIEGTEELYSCVSEEIQIPDIKTVATIQYAAKGFQSKATELQLILKLKKDGNSNEIDAVKKVWAIYSAVMIKNLFGMGFNEKDLQALSELQAPNVFEKTLDNRLVISAKVANSEEFTYYEYNVHGLPMMGVN